MTTNKASNTRRWLFGLALSSAALTTTSALAQEVVLRSNVNDTFITGTVLSFEDGSYTLQTTFGELVVEAEGMTCEGSGCVSDDAVAGFDEPSIRIAGSNSIGVGLMPLLMQNYGTNFGADTVLTDADTDGQFYAEYVGESGFGEKLSTHLVTSTNTTNAFEALLDGSIDIGMAARRITPQEARALRDSGAGSMIDPNQERILAVDSLAVITHPDNPVNTLTVDQLAAIYTGEIRNWAEVGGDDLPIVVVHHGADSATGQLFNERVLGAADAALSKAAVRMDNNNDVAEIVNTEPSVIGFVGLAFQRGAQVVTLTNQCGITVAPDAFTARTEEYLLQRRLYLYNRGDTLTDEASEFLEHIQSPEVESVILKSGFVDLGVERREMPLDGSRAVRLTETDASTYERGVINDLLAEMEGHDRLSTTFRFSTASSRLDERAREDLDRLASYLEAQPEGTEVRFVGFTDDVGPFDANLNVSVDRATQIMQELQNFAGNRLSGISMDVSGYGPISPADCNTNEDGRRVNRRVEVWIKRS